MGSNFLKQEGLLVSVIVPNYNHENFLRKRLNSIFSQSYSRYEVILLDDASTDASLQILKEYENKANVSYLVANDSNSGSAVAQWEKGLEYARGDLVWIPESDDFCKSNLLERLVAEYERYGADITYCDSLIVDDSGLPIDYYNYGSKFFTTERWKSQFFNDGRDEIIQYLAYRNTIPNASAVLFKKSSLTKAIDVGEGFYYMADWRIYIEILLSGTIRYVPERLNFFREHQTTTRSFRGRDYDRMFSERTAILDCLLRNRSIDTSTYDQLIKSGAMNSVAVRSLYDDRIRRAAEQLASLLTEGHEITVWGNNYLSRTLLSLVSGLDVKKGRIVQIVDRRLSGINWSYCGVPLGGPEEIRSEEASTILIASQSSVDSIRADIIERLGVLTQVVTFEDLLS